MILISFEKDKLIIINHAVAVLYAVSIMHVPSKVPSLTCLYNQTYGTSHDDDASVDLWIKKLNKPVHSYFG